jgi:hypothetical protein
MINWVVIKQWPGLQLIHIVKISRMCQLQDFQDQFERHVLHCPMMMDKVLSAIMQQQMDHASREFIKLLIVKVIESPERYQGTIDEASSFEDFCIRKFCTQLAIVFFNNI